MPFASVAVSGGGIYPSGRAVYSCQAGYELVDAAANTLSCGSAGSWQGTMPQCRGVLCSSLSLGNGSVAYSSASRRYPSTANFSCDANRFLAGASSLVCQTDGSWSGSVPDCVLSNVRGWREEEIR